MELKQNFFLSDKQISYLGEGELGGKAKGLDFINSVLESKIGRHEFPEFEINIPKMVVIRTNVFDSFMSMNGLWDIALSDKSDERIALAFQKADLPFSILGDLRIIVNEIKQPLAIRSSSLLEDAMDEPFAGIYKTKMIPNNQPDTDGRFRKLVEAIKFVYASTYFNNAKKYISATKHNLVDEKMAVILQEVVGEQHQEKFYPEISGVACSYNFYPTLRASPEDGIVNLALGLGKTIVDGGISWAYTPEFPKIDPPFKSIKEMLKQTQLKFWSVNMGKPPEYDPITETEYLFENHFMDAQRDGTLENLVSTYNPQSDRVLTGVGSDGPKILTFAPIIKMPDSPFNKLVKMLMKVAEGAFCAPVEIEFALTIPKNKSEPYRFGFLQVRPLAVSSEEVNITEDETIEENILISSDMVLGNGSIKSIKDIVFIKPEKFDNKFTHIMAKEIELIDKKLSKENKQYILIGFGRWGTTDEWAGVPVDFSQISGAKVIVEATLENMNQEMSQASHFFHNVTSFQVYYFSVPHSQQSNINWNKICSMNKIEETKFIKHVESKYPIKIEADGRTGRGIIKISSLGN